MTSKRQRLLYKKFKAWLKNPWVLKWGFFLLRLIEAINNLDE